jgi:hypothetical protein
MSVTRRYPYSVLPRRNLPLTWLPHVGVSVPAMISAYPNVPWAGPFRAAFMNGHRRPKLDHDLRCVRGDDTDSDAADSGEDEFAQFKLPPYIYLARTWPHASYLVRYQANLAEDSGRYRLQVVQILRLEPLAVFGVERLIIGLRTLSHLINGQIGHHDPQLVAAGE